MCGRDVGGIFDLEGPNTPPGTRPHIGVMLKVVNADATCEKVTSLGGTAMPAFDIMDQGRMAVCNDPNGAEFDVWEPRTFLGTDVDSSLHGAPSWFEVLTTDVDRATKFYSELFGWTPEAKPMPGFTYTIFRHAGAEVAGLMPIPPEMVNVRPHWGTYFTVTDADEAAREAVRLGAKLHVPVRDIPGVGRFCGITSPQGVKFYVIRYAAV
jgi:predicted enzyme related to lactoylglutathione lyase